jgi:hypothetical protein
VLLSEQKPEIKEQTTTHWPTENRQKDKQKPEIKGQTTTHWSTENRQKDKQKPEIKEQTTTHWPTENPVCCCLPFDFWFLIVLLSVFC